MGSLGDFYDSNAAAPFRRAPIAFSQTYRHDYILGSDEMELWNSCQLTGD